MAETLREVQFRLNRLAAERRQLAAELARIDAAIASSEAARAALFKAWIEERTPHLMRLDAVHG